MKITVIAPAYFKENIRLQPWRYLYEITKHLATSKCEVTVITDGYPKLRRDTVIGNVSVKRLRHVKHFPPINSNNIIKATGETSPDVILWLTGLTSFFQKRLCKSFQYDVVALVSSPLYSLQEFLTNLGLIEAARHSKILMTNFAENLIPRCLIRDTFNLDAIRYAVTMSERNRQKLKHIGVQANKLVSIPPGTDSFFLRPPSFEEIEKARKEICGDLANCFLITYFGPPLTIRGIDTILLAAKLALRRLPVSVHLRILLISREQNREFEVRLERLLKLIDKLSLNDITKIKRGFLSKNEMKIYISASDLVALPFKYVVSDAPISIMEGMCLGKAVLSTDLDGIPELLEDSRGIIMRPGNYRQMADIIAHYATRKEKLTEYGERAKKYMIHHFTWKDSASRMLSLFKNIKGA